MLIASSLTRAVNGKTLVDGVSARFESGKLNVILGPNGAGKSTLLRLLTGQLRPTAGSVKLGDRDLRELSLMQLARVRAVLSQNVEIAFPLRVREVVMMGRYPHFSGRPAADDERACEEVLALFELADMAERDFLTLSGGEQQRVHFARVMAQIWFPHAGATRYLFLDEPLRSLDVFHQLDFMRKLRELRRPDLVMVAVLHDLNLAAAFADELLLLNAGRVLAAGSPLKNQRRSPVSPRTLKTSPTNTNSLSANAASRSRAARNSARRSPAP